MAEDGEGPIEQRPFVTIRPPLREVRGPEADMQNAAKAIHSRTLENRTMARRDAANAVSRARERAGFPRADWSGAEVDILHAITDLLLQIQGQDRGAKRAQPEEPPTRA